ncbi:MAG: IS66 family transposase [Bacilli bacterium]|nr:IS66 family transposase [Bacilli bacterium]MDY5929595.1 IS66 family transposase [Candidatus Onthovivens sp.]
MKSNEELLEYIEKLEKEVKLLKDAHVKDQEILRKQEYMLQEKDLKIYETNMKLEQALLIIQNYEEKYNIERTKIFIPKTEKLEDIVINETEEVIKEQRKTNKGKKYKKKTIDYEKLVSEVRIINPEEEICPKCGEKLVVVSEKVRYLVEVIPSSIKVIKIIKVSKKCPHCNKEDNKIYYPVVKEALSGSLLSSSLAAFVAYHKYELGIPFEHLANHITNNVGFEINKQNLANYMAKVSNILEPIYDRMLNDLLNNKHKVIHSDETTLVVTKRDEANKDRKKSYVYVYTSSFYDKNRIRIYDFQENRCIDKTAKWLTNYKGVIECDNYNGYNSLKKNNENIKLQKCWVHVRRKYADIVKNLKKEQKKNSKAYKILEAIKQLFYLEATYKKDKLIPSEIVERRQKEVPSIKEKIRKLVFESNPIKGSALEMAINYTKECWDDLFTFVNNGYVEISNNIAEQAVKPFVIQRKVFQTSGSYAGARYTSKLFSLVQTCKINNVNVESYFKYVLENINNERVENLLPYSSKILKELNKG